MTHLRDADILLADHDRALIHHGSRIGSLERQLDALQRDVNAHDHDVEVIERTTTITAPPLLQAVLDAAVRWSKQYRPSRSIPAPFGDLPYADAYHERIRLDDAVQAAQEAGLL